MNEMKSHSSNTGQLVALLDLKMAASTVNYSIMF